MLPGAFDFAISGIIAASNCISPSIASSGAFSFASSVAILTLSTSSAFALPFVEYESIATFGSFSSICLKLFAVDIAISDNSSEFGF